MTYLFPAIYIGAPCHPMENLGSLGPTESRFVFQELGGSIKAEADLSDQNPSWLGCIGGEILPSCIGSIVNHYIKGSRHLY